MGKKKMGDLAPFYFHQGTNYLSYEYMGAHKEKDSFVFRVWAPHADSVFLTGDFCAWDESFPMKRITKDGIWEVSLPFSCDFGDFSNYKYKIRTRQKEIFKSDPYAFLFEVPPATSSRFFDIEGYEWHDDGWMKARKKTAEKLYSSPMNIYEMHLLSWKRHEDETPLTYRELAKELPPYIKQMGYTHVEFMPVMEHPFDGSWGYQVCGYYAPTSRLGSPKDLMFLIDELHRSGIGVILDWVPAHFPKDAHGLYEFDGVPLYEYQGWDKMEHEGWGTRRFDLGRNEIQSFLVSNAVFWAEKYHADGLRVDAVASMIYLDYEKEPGKWLPNSYGDNRNLEGVAFLRKLNSYMREKFPDVMMIAEESTAWQNITGFEGDMSLGFTLKWNMGWMNDLLKYAEADPIYRSSLHDKLTFSMFYAFNEKFVLPISHDEVVHGKKSFLDKMPGDYHMKFAGTRAFMTYIMTHPGKKLSFMGSEIGQFREWDYAGQIEWFLLDYEMHARMQKFVSDLNHIYLENKAFWEIEDSWDGFKWIDADNRNESIFSMRRIARDGSEIITVVNFTPVEKPNFHLGVPKMGEYEVLLCSDDGIYGGSNMPRASTYNSFKCETYTMNGFEQAIIYPLAPMSASVLKLKKQKNK
ncbi:MAG: 1,4-alpha-glucan branching protein GlgB [Clostridia bacterium]|nr:1,4-alpha-glucan branching protein GlgB [Clostridia bacterium]